MDLNLQGRVELCLNNAWGTVCNSTFGSEELQVICTQLTGVTSVGKEMQPNLRSQFCFNSMKKEENSLQ